MYLQQNVLAKVVQIESSKNHNLLNFFHLLYTRGKTGGFSTNHRKNFELLPAQFFGDIFEEKKGPYT